MTGFLNPSEASPPQPIALELEHAWARFVNGQGVDQVVPPIISESWKRCWAHINPRNPVLFTLLKAAHLQSIQNASSDLISIARPIMEDVFQCVENASIALLLANSAGCLLDIFGDHEILALLQRWGVEPGVILTEDQIGTNGIGLALSTRMPVQVAGVEHYVAQFHSIASAASPVFDPSGHPLGVLGIVTLVETYHSYLLGLVMSAARAIESQRLSDLLLGEQNEQLSQLNTILSAISDGILVWNNKNILMHANPAASRILNLPVDSWVGRPVNSLFTISPGVIEAINEHRPLVDIETMISTSEHQVRCLLSVEYVLNKGNTVCSIVTLRPEKTIRKLVQHQVGASAVLTLEDIPGVSSQMQRIRNSVRSVARAEASVLIRGEIGTGKNALASAIHNAGAHRDGPFLIFNAASIPNELVISELLGYEENLINGKHASRPSKFELAQGGTLFFQDVDALPLEAQSVLLNALEIGIVQRMGGQRLVPVDTRIVASSYANIEALIAQGSFRADLYYRLSAFSINIPPLRERPQDIEPVVERILRRLSTQLGVPVKLGPGVLEVLQKSPWPGNIREIESTLARVAMQAGPAGLLEIDRMPVSIRYATSILLGSASDSGVQSLEELEHEAIIHMAELCRGNTTLMAAGLGISRTTLWRRLKRFHINPGEYRNGNHDLHSQPLAVTTTRKIK